MATIEDLTTILEDYPDNYVSIRFPEFKPPKTVFNDGEVADFTIEITNRGELDMVNVFLNVDSYQGYTDLARSDPPTYSGSLKTVFFHLAAGQSTSVPGRFRVRALKHSNRQIIELLSAHIGGWEADPCSLKFSGHD